MSQAWETRRPTALHAPAELQTPPDRAILYPTRFYSGVWVLIPFELWEQFTMLPGGRGGIAGQTKVPRDETFVICDLLENWAGWVGGLGGSVS